MTIEEKELLRLLPAKIAIARSVLAKLIQQWNILDSKSLQQKLR